MYTGGVQTSLRLCIPTKDLLLAYLLVCASLFTVPSVAILGNASYTQWLARWIRGCGSPVMHHAALLCSGLNTPVFGRTSIMLYLMPDAPRRATEPAALGPPFRTACTICWPGLCLHSIHITCANNGSAAKPRNAFFIIQLDGDLFFTWGPVFP